MPRRKSKFTCPKCGQSFGLAMHLGRHLSAIHGQVRAKSRKGVRGPKPGRRGGRRGRPVGRPAGAGGRLGLRNMSLEQLVEVISAAKDEAGRRIAEFQEAMR